MRRDDPAFRYRQALSPILRPVLIVLGLVLTAFAGSVAASHWDTFQMWSNSTTFGTKDPHFGKDVGFYVFDYPWMRFLTSFSFAMIVISVIAVVFISYVFGGIRLAGRGPRFTRAAQVHLSVLLGLGVLLRAFSYYLDRFGLAVGSSALFDGIGYTDANARIPARNILIGVAIVCALLLFAAAIIRSWVLPAIGLGLLLLTSILIGGIWPFVMQSFQVKPSEPDKEGPYIARNIEATREAYDVADTKVGVLHRQDLAHRRPSSPGRRSRGSAPACSTPRSSPTAFEQLQQVRGYYAVPETLDVDRYKIGDDAQPQDIIIAARELNLAGLQASQRNWANDHTVYTHGYGVIAARGNQRGPQGEPVWVEKDIPPTGELEAQAAAAHLLRRELAGLLDRRPAEGCDADRGRHPARRRVGERRRGERHPEHLRRHRRRAGRQPLQQGARTPSSSPSRTSCCRAGSTRRPRSSTTATRASASRRSRRGSPSTATRTRPSSTARSSGSSTATRPATPTRTPSTARCARPPTTP